MRLETTLLMYLTSWKEGRTIGLRRKPLPTPEEEKVCLCWKGYDFDTLDQLDGQGLIINGHGRGPIILCDKGVQLAQELLHKYGLIE